MTTPHTDIAVTINDVELTASAGYVVVGNSLGDAARTWRRSYAQSPWVDGSYLVSAVRDQTVLGLSVRVTGSSIGDMRDKMQTLLDAVADFTYEVEVDMEGTVDTWTADPADYTVAGETWQDGRLRTFHQIISLSIPVRPVPETSVTGS